MRTTILVFMLTVAGCGGVISQDSGEGSDAVTRYPIGPTPACRLLNPGYISLDDFQAPAWELFGEPLRLWSGPTVDGNTPDTHTVSLTSVCGTESTSVNVGKM